MRVEYTSLRAAARTIYQGCGAIARTVRAQGTVASPAFTELFYTLAAATGLQI